jgi:KTSC domain
LNPELSRLENLLSELMQGIQAVLQAGEILSDEFQGVLAQAIGSLFDQIETIKANHPDEPSIEDVEEEQAQVANQGQPPQPPPTPPTGGPIPPLEPAPFESSNINAMRYDPDKQEAYIKFQGKFPAQNGPVYKYSGVPAYIFDVIQRGSVAPKTSGANQWHRWKEGVTPSHGASVNALLKAGGFQYQRLS